MEGESLGKIPEVTASASHVIATATAFEAVFETEVASSITIIPLANL